MAAFNDIAERLTDEQAGRIGAELAYDLCLRRDPEHDDRWQTSWGSKTDKGLALTVLGIMDQAVPDMVTTPSREDDRASV